MRSFTPGDKHMLPLAVMPLNCVVRSSGNPNVTFEKAFVFTLTTDVNLIEHLSRSLFLLPFSAALGHNLEVSTN